MGRIRKVLIAVLITAGLLGFTSCNNNLTTALIDKITKEKSEIPIPGGDGKLTTSVGMEYITVSWTKGSDNKTNVSDLEYLVCISENSADVATVEEAVKYAFGNFEKDIATKDVTGLLDNYPYWVNVVVRDGSGNKAVYTSKSDTTVKHPRIYWTDGGSDKIQLSDLDGANDDDLVTTGLGNPYAIAVDPVDRKIYWADSGTAKIQWSDFDGQNAEDLVTVGLNNPYGIAVDYSLSNRYLYWTDGTNNEIYRSPLPPTNTDTSTYMILDSGDGVDSPRGIDVDVYTHDFFWTEIGVEKRIRKAPAISPSGNITNLIFSGLNEPIDVAVDYVNEVFYWTDRGSVKIQSRTYITAPINDLIDTNLDKPSGITIDIGNANIFWVDAIKGKVYKSPTNPVSKDAEDYDLPITGLINPRGIQIY